MKRFAGCLALLLATAIVTSEGRAGILGSYTVAHVFDASVAVPGIAIAGLHFDEANGFLYLPGSTDFTQQPSIRVFATIGAFVQEYNMLAPSRSQIDDIDAVPGSGDIYALDGENTVYRMDITGQVIASRALNDSFVSGGVHGAAGLSVNQATGNIWIAESSSPYRMIEMDPSFGFIRSIDMFPLLGNRGSPNYAGVTGLEIDPATGNFLVAGIFGKTIFNNDDLIYWNILEINPEFTTVLSEFADLSNLVQWQSITGVSIGPQSRTIFVSSGDTDAVFELRQIPEPSSFILAALGLIGLVVWRRRRPLAG